MKNKKEKQKKLQWHPAFCSALRLELLEDTNALLHSLIREGDASFVYEKIGTTIDTVMIDEFHHHRGATPPVRPSHRKRERSSEKRHPQ